MAGYRASGGINGAVAQSAERLYARVDTESRHLLRDLVLRLVSPGAQGEPVRTRVPRRLIATDHEHDQLIEMLVGARLVTSDDGVLEVTHEALARAWPRLRGWLDDDVEGQRTLHHLSGAADAWDHLGRPDSELYRGVRLARALDWQARTSSALTGAERGFLDAGRAAAEAEEQSAAERVRTQARLISRLRLVLTGAVVLLVLALAAGGVAAVQSDRASENASVARAAESTAQQAATIALARGAAARSGTTEDIDTGLLLGVAGVRLQESPETVSSLMTVLARHPALIWSAPLAGGEPMGLDLSPEGRTVAVVDSTQHVRLMDTETGDELADRQVGGPRYAPVDSRPVRFSPNGRVLAVGQVVPSQQPVVLLEPDNLLPLAQQPKGVPAGAWRTIGLAFSEDGESVVAVLNRLESSEVAFGDTTAATWAFVWPLDDLSEPKRVNLFTDWSAVALSPDGSLLYTGTPRLRVHDLRTGEVRVLIDEEAASLDISRGGRLLAFSPPVAGASLGILNTTTGRVRHRLDLDGEAALVRFSSDGQRVLATSWQGREAVVWEAVTGEELMRSTLGEGQSGAVDLDASGARVVTADLDNALRGWDVEGERRYLTRIPIEGLPWNSKGGGACLAKPSTDGAWVSYTICDDQTRPTLLVLDVERRTTFERLAGRDYPGATGSWNARKDEYVQAVGGVVRVWDGHTGRLIERRRVGGQRVADVDYSPDGSRLVLSNSSRVVLLDAETLARVGQPVDLGEQVWAKAGPDDRAFALVGESQPALNRWALVDLKTGSVLHEGEPRVGILNGMAFASDGRHAAVGGNSGHVVIIDAASGEPVHEPVRAHAAGVGWLAFSPDGARLVTGAYDGSVVLWDVETGGVTARASVPASVPTSAEFLSDGRVLFVPWWQDPAVYEWDPNPVRAIEFACRAADARRRPPGHQRRRRPRGHPRGPGPGLAPPTRLARRRHRGATDPPPPLGRRRRLGHPRPPRQRALPRRPARPRAGLAGPDRVRPHRRRTRLPRRGTSGRRDRGAQRRGTGPGPSTPDRTAALGPHWRRRAPRPRPRRRRRRRRPVQPRERQCRQGRRQRDRRRGAARGRPGPDGR